MASASSETIETARIRGEIARFVVEDYRQGSAGAAVNAATPLLGGTTLDSIGMLELSLHLEETYGIAIAAEEITTQHFGTVGSLARFIDEKMRAS